ncbi:hypothetical protein [Edwardsiella ictaluri]|uniref:hypothetical protein n=1 Tax=Edwardsiella ictaluri TaxID=67780 RepID=UPI0018DEBE4C|nr:hypothetical protein [Edwardsiella ictaluri]QPW29761.1 hypothetical protein F8539_06930 [Edwardsiella ictaluri]
MGIDVIRINSVLLAALKAFIGASEIIHNRMPAPISVVRVSYRLINKTIVAIKTTTPNITVSINDSPQIYGLFYSE